MLNFYWQKNTTVILAILLLCSIGLAFILPRNYAYENHLLENLEVVILFGGIIINIWKLLQYDIYESIKFYIASSLIYLLMIGRELNWGRVFYPVKTLPDGDAVLISLDKLWYGQYVYPLVVIIAIIAILILGYFIYECVTQHIQWYLPMGEIIFFIVMSILSQLIFELEIITYLAKYNQMLEEFTEIIAYISLVCCSYHIRFIKRYISIKYFQIKLRF